MCRLLWFKLPLLLLLKHLFWFTNVKIKKDYFWQTGFLGTANTASSQNRQRFRAIITYNKHLFSWEVFIPDILFWINVPHFSISQLCSSISRIIIVTVNIYTPCRYVSFCQRSLLLGKRKQQVLIDSLLKIVIAVTDARLYLLRNCLPPPHPPCCGNIK